MDIPSLANLDYIEYLDTEGQIPAMLDAKVGAYAIFDQNRQLQFVGYSRDIALSLKQHLVRCPEHCYWVKVQVIDRPSRAILEEIQTAWITENGSTPIGNSTDHSQWTQAIDVKPLMTEAEKASFQSTDELGQIKLLKTVARRIEARILDQLQARGANLPVRFNPKLKESGLLDLKP